MKVISELSVIALCLPLSPLARMLMFRIKNCFVKHVLIERSKLCGVSNMSILTPYVKLKDIIVCLNKILQTARRGGQLSGVFRK